VRAVTVVGLLLLFSTRVRVRGGGGSPRRCHPTSSCRQLGEGGGGSSGRAAAVAVSTGVRVRVGGAHLVVVVGDQERVVVAAAGLLLFSTGVRARVGGLTSLLCVR